MPSTNEPMLNTGAISQEEKPSDFNLAELASATPLPDEYHTPYAGIIYHQHKTPSCGAHAGTYVKNVQEGRNHSPAYLWKRIKQTDNLPPEAGTSMEYIFKSLKKYGVCSLDLLANTTEQSLTVYTDPSVITPAMDTDALKSRIGAYGYIWSPTIDQIKRAIYDFKIIIMRIEISADWWIPSWKEVLPLKHIYPGQGGHFVVGIGYGTDTIDGLNEWGVDWGDDGRFYFKGDYIGRITYIGTCFDYVEKAPIAITRVLHEGMIGTDVGLVQQALKDQGYFLHSVTKTFGPITKKAVTDFQQKHGLKVDGIVGPLTAKLLFS